MRSQEIKKNYFTLARFEPFEVKQQFFLGSIIQKLGRFPTPHISLELILHVSQVVLTMRSLLLVRGVVSL